MFLPPQQVIVCDRCSYDETFELHELGEYEWQLDINDLKNAGWKVVNEETCYCSDCKEEVNNA